MDFSAICGFLDQTGIEHYFNANASQLVSFRIGGLAKVVIYPKTIDELTVLMRYLSNERFVILGNGTNCYFTNDNYNGAVIVTNKINEVYSDGDFIIAHCGAGLGSLCKHALTRNLSGLEFAYGIPGTVGGAVYMNASAFGASMSSVVYESTVLDLESGEVYSLSLPEHNFSEKHSVFMERRMVLLYSKFKCTPSTFEKISEEMLENLEKRRRTQPGDMYSAGCVFVKPQNQSASRLIDLAGLKGTRIGDAQVSTKHAGFIVNLGGATAGDVQELIKIIKDKVFSLFGVNLKEEIIYIE